MPGGLTVPPLFGWENILAVLLALVVVGVAFIVVGSTGGSRNERAEFQAYLDARSGHRRDPGDVPAVRPGPDRGGPRPGTDHPADAEGRGLTRDRTRARPERPG